MQWLVYFVSRAENESLKTKLARLIEVQCPSNVYIVGTGSGWLAQDMGGGKKFWTQPFFPPCNTGCMYLQGIEAGPYLGQISYPPSRDRNLGPHQRWQGHDFKICTK